jgi:hypothetical protein
LIIIFWYKNNIILISHQQLPAGSDKRPFVILDDTKWLSDEPFEINGLTTAKESIENLAAGTE